MAETPRRIVLLWAFTPTILHVAHKVDACSMRGIGGRRSTDTQNVTNPKPQFPCLPSRYPRLETYWPLDLRCVMQLEILLAFNIHVVKDD
ncbi:hypothetical protein HDV57DRAFT_486498 [Trichoderma longibrachiatum]